MEEEMSRYTIEMDSWLVRDLFEFEWAKKEKGHANRVYVRCEKTIWTNAMSKHKEDKDEELFVRFSVDVVTREEEDKDLLLSGKIFCWSYFGFSSVFEYVRWSTIRVHWRFCYLIWSVWLTSFGAILFHRNEETSSEFDLFMTTHLSIRSLLYSRLRSIRPDIDKDRSHSSPILWYKVSIEVYSLHCHIGERICSGDWVFVDRVETKWFVHLKRRGRNSVNRSISRNNCEESVIAYGCLVELIGAKEKKNAEFCSCSGVGAERKLLRMSFLISWLTFKGKLTNWKWVRTLYFLHSWMILLTSRFPIEARRRERSLLKT